MAKAKSIEPKTTTPSGELSVSADSSTFEEILGELENLVESMESDQVPLGELIENYEKGTHLYELCQQHLDDAQRRVDLIREGVDSAQKKLQPFDEKNSPLERTEDSQTNTQTDDGQLF